MWQIKSFQVEKVDKSAKHKKGVSIIKEAGNLKSEENLSPCVAVLPSPALSAQLPTSSPVPPAPPFWIPAPPFWIPALPSVPSQAVGKQISSSVKVIWMKKNILTQNTA